VDIILNTSFNNPNLPVMPLPGFFDDFDRDEADVLGQTVDGKLWKIFNPGTTSSVWGTYGDGTGGMKSSTVQHHIAAVDALTANGTLTAHLASFDETAPTRRFGLAVRVLDANNYVVIAPISHTGQSMRIAYSINGSLQLTDDRGPDLAPGDTVSATMLGDTITASVNGTQFATATIPELSHGTQHGLYSFYESVSAWDMIEFTP